eukprot:1323262-Heterocapsa_arctica.AAC.1
MFLGMGSAGQRKVRTIIKCGAPNNVGGGEAVAEGAPPRAKARARGTTQEPTSLGCSPHDGSRRTTKEPTFLKAVGSF